MRVKDLIAKLKVYNEDAEVYTSLEDTQSPNVFDRRLQEDMIEKEIVCKNGDKVYIVTRFPLDF